MEKVIRSTIAVMLMLAVSIGISGAQTVYAASSADVQVSDGWLPFAGSL